MTEEGVGYGTAPTVTVSNPALGIASERAIGIASLGTIHLDLIKSTIFVSNPGENYDNTATVTMFDPETISGVGTYHFNEVIQGMRSGTQGRVKSWDVDTGILQVGNVGIGTTTWDSFPAKISKDSLLVHYSVFLYLMTMILQINIMKAIYLN